LTKARMMPVKVLAIRPRKTKRIKNDLKLYGFGWFIKTANMVDMNQVFSDRGGFARQNGRHQAVALLLLQLYFPFVTVICQ